MRRILQRIVFAINAALLNGARLLADGEHRGAEAVELGLGFRFRRFDHERARYRPTHGRRMEAAVDKPLCDVIDSDPGAIHQWPCVDDAFVSHATRSPLIEHRVCAFEPLGDVVGIENCNARCLGQTAPAHQQAVAPRNRQDGRRAIGRRRDCELAAIRFGMSRQERNEMRLHADRPHTWAAAAVGNAERLVQIEMADVSADIAGSRETHKRVEIGAVEIDLTAVRVRDVANLDHGFFKHAVRRWIGDHAGRQPLGMLFRFGAEIGHVDVAVCIRYNNDDRHAAHLRRRRISAMRRRRNEADVSLVIAAAAVIPANCQQACVFALRTGVRLHGNGIIAGDVAQLLRQIVDQLFVTERLIGRHERMHLGKFRP